MHPNLQAQDVIYERVPKIRAILNCLLTAWDNCLDLDHDTVYNILWSIDDDLREIMECKK